MKRQILYSAFILCAFIASLANAGNSAAAGAMGGVAGFMIGRATAPRETQYTTVREVQYVDTGSQAVASANAENARLRQRLTQKSCEIDDLNAQIERLKRENKRLKDENKDLLQEAEDARAQLKQTARDARKMKQVDAKIIEKLEK
ncbi:MAG TPA: hypothetical protein VHO47_01425 [Candidatus Babeliales bacterium]|nr:hypothetical protein [Candidatus Babeliales bacterium]